VSNNKTTRRAIAVALALSVFGACKDSTGVPELNNLTDDLIANGIDRSSASLLLTGLIDRDRGSVDNRYLVFSSTLSRDVFRLDSAEPRWVTELLAGSPDAGGFVGSGAFSAFFNVIRTANTLIEKLPTAKRAELAPQFQLSDAEIAGVRGVARTIKAQALFRALEMRDTLGLPIAVGGTASTDLAPFVCKKNVLAYIATLLDSAQTDLGAAGSSFYFSLPAGYQPTLAQVDLTTPAGFLKFNRALKGKVEFYRGMDGDATAFARSLTALNASYLNTAGSLNIGPVYTYSTSPGETSNPTFDNNIYANPHARDSLQTGDTRVAKFAGGTSSRYGFSGKGRLAETRTATTSNQTRNRRILSNEELILLRAQVEIEQNDLPAATADINVVRTQYGLASLPLLLDKESARSALLYEKRYSLFFEGAQHFDDLRAYGRYNATYLAPENSGDSFVRFLPIPKAEVDQRGGTVVKTCS
jgi:SusD family.